MMLDKGADKICAWQSAPLFSSKRPKTGFYPVEVQLMCPFFLLSFLYIKSQASRALKLNKKYYICLFKRAFLFVMNICCGYSKRKS